MNNFYSIDKPGDTIYYIFRYPNTLHIVDKSAPTELSLIY